MRNNIISKFFSGSTLRKKQGFTLVEVLTALFIVSVGLSGAYALVNQTIAAANIASMKLTAAYLGKEGIEIVRNIRDGNYIMRSAVAGYDQPESWMSGINCSSGCPIPVNCQSGCMADYYSSALSAANIGQPLKYSSQTGFYGYSSGDATPFFRTITITPHSDYLDVSVRVDWAERGRSHYILVQEYIYNWWEI